ncbi:hypothetical protein NQ318_011401 [Aromia moschata]|uniref:beta-fructofuranosidase n=1 Tax=Aromia moschata TaxID=1265417 RepID=A0AAV8YVC1_9CUCU|nr:hypothetical protein NQ318_011401 [Aromia moschata]
MNLTKIFIIFLITVITQSFVLASKDSEFTVEKANEYIAANKDNVIQTYRLHYHFMAPIGWINDPNGFIYHKGEYHLFYQYNPYSATANKIHWGHAKSKDLVHWEHLPVAMAPDHDYDADGVFSGSSMEKDGKLYVMYTGNSENRQVQCVAVSEDDITFEKVAENPVIEASTLPSNAQPQDFRDPKVIKRDDRYYVVTVSKTTENTGQVLLYQSEDLIKWEFKSILLQGTSAQGIMWECPDVFELDGKDVLILSAIQMPVVGDDYHNIDSVIAFVGTIDWDEGNFQVETMKELDHGMDFYATQTLLDDKGRRVAISWMNMWGRSYPTAELGQGWAGAMTLPRILSLKYNYLVQTPIPEIIDNYNVVTAINDTSIRNSSFIVTGVRGAVGHLELVLEIIDASYFEILVRMGQNEKTFIVYMPATNELILNRTMSGMSISGGEDLSVDQRQVKVPLEDNKLSLEIFLDSSSVEIFANNGTETLTANIYPTEESSDGIQFTVVANEYIADTNQDNVNQTYRLQYHFMAPIGWINDPNGFIYHKGEYHLFYQYNPYSSVWNEIHWSHAKSKDLVHWEHLPVGMAPDHGYDYGGVYSGSSIEKDGKLYVMYTGNSGNSQVQCIAISEDDMTFEKVAENPVIDPSSLPTNAQSHEFRDPNVFKRGDLYYVVTVSKTIESTGQVVLYQSDDLFKWESSPYSCKATAIKALSVEMPQVGDDYDNPSSVIAFVGEVDWTEGKFQVETVKELDHGMEFYATQTSLDNEGRRIAISWMSIQGASDPTADLNQGWAGSMTLPRVLNLRNNYLVQTPIPEIANSYELVKNFSDYTVKDQSVSFTGVEGKVAELELEVDLKDLSESFDVQLRVSKNEKTLIRYVTATQELILDRTNSGVSINRGEDPAAHIRQVKVPLEDHKVSLQIFLDRSSVEIFANNGTETLTASIYPTQESSDSIQFTAVGSAVINYLSFSKITVIDMKEYSHENIRFWMAVNDLRRSAQSQIAWKIQDIFESLRIHRQFFYYFREFLAPGAPCEINIDGKTMEKAKSGNAAVCAGSPTTDPALVEIAATLSTGLTLLTASTMELSIAVTARQLSEIYGETCISIQHVRKWCREFSEGRTDIHDEKRSGRPSISDEVVEYGAAWRTLDNSNSDVDDEVNKSLRSRRVNPASRIRSVPHRCGL